MKDMIDLAIQFLANEWHKEYGFAPANLDMVEALADRNFSESLWRDEKLAAMHGVIDIITESNNLKLNRG